MTSLLSSYEPNYDYIDTYNQYRLSGTLSVFVIIMTATSDRFSSLTGRLRFVRRGDTADANLNQAVEVHLYVWLLA